MNFTLLDRRDILQGDHLCHSVGWPGKPNTHTAGRQEWHSGTLGHGMKLVHRWDFFSREDAALLLRSFNGLNQAHQSIWDHLSLLNFYGLWTLITTTKSLQRNTEMNVSLNTWGLWPGHVDTGDWLTCYALFLVYCCLLLFHLISLHQHLPVRTVWFFYFYIFMLALWKHTHRKTLHKNKII